MSLASTNSTMRGVWFFDDGGRTPRTRDRSRDHEVAPQEPKSERERQVELANYYLAAHERRQAEDRADEQRKANEQHQRRLREQAEVDRRRQQKLAAEDLKRRRGIFEFHEAIEQQIFAEAGLTKQERHVVNNRLIDADSVHDLELTKVLCLQIVAERK
jgi:hypothetical protein